MCKKLLLLMPILLLVLFASHAVAKPRHRVDQPEKKLGWKFGAQAYTFRKFTFTEALDKIASCGLQYVEAFPGQKIGGGIEGSMDYNMPEETKVHLKKILKEKGVKLISFGVIQVNDVAEWRKLFAFAKSMGIQNITCEPEERFLPDISKLCDEFGINAAIHNHPNPSHYWNPTILLNAIKGLSPRVGACADIGHWVRSGLDPVTCLKQLDGHIIQLHFKDLNEKSSQAHDVHWTTGVNNIPGVLAELKRQKFKGLFSAEYEYNWDNNAEDVKVSVQNVRNLLK